MSVSPYLSSKSFTSTSRESSCDSDQKPSDWDEYRVDDENSQSTYLECQNQLHYYQKYHERTGQLPLEMGCQYALPDSEADGSTPDTEKAEGKDISHTSCGTQTVADIQRTRKRQRSIGDPNGDSDKENLRTLSTHKSKRPRKGRNAVQLLENAVQLSQKAVNLSQEAICLSQTVVSLLDKED